MADNLNIEQFDTAAAAQGSKARVAIAANELSAGLLSPAVQLLASDATTADNRVPASATLGLTVRATPAGTATLANVASSITAVTLLAANAGRLGMVIENESTSVLYVKFGTAASATSYTYSMAANTRLDTRSSRSEYTGIVTGIWVTANGSARTTELSV